MGISRIAENCIMAIYRELCTTKKWDKINLTETEANNMGLKVLDYIYEKEVRGKTCEDLKSRWKFIEEYKSNSYGGTNLTNYQLRQMATYMGTPSMEQLRRIGS